MSGVIPVKIVAPGEGSQPARNFVPGSCKLADANSSQPVAMRQEDFAIAAGSGAVAALGPAAWYKWNQNVTGAQWNDAAGANHLVQGTGASQPTKNADGSLTFDGVDDNMKVAFALNQPSTIYLLFRQITWTNNDVIHDGNTLASHRVFQATASPQLFLRASANVGPVAPPVGVYSVVASVLNGASSLIQSNLGTPVTGDAGLTNPAGFTLGANGTPGSYSNIEVKEAIVFAGAHDATKRQTVIEYLMRLGGI
jgi:hypothetical protein